MAVYNNSQQTEVGHLLENRIRNGEGVMEFTCIKVGAGIYTDEEKREISRADSLKEVRQVFSFSGITPEKGNDYLVLESVITNDGLETGYYLSELGIFARVEGSTEEVLYCIGLVDQPDYIPPQTIGKYKIMLQSLIKCHNAENVIIQYEDKTYATAEALIGHVNNSTVHITVSEREKWNDTALLLDKITCSGAITEVKIVDALPADAASHPTTFYWIRG